MVRLSGGRSEEQRKLLAADAVILLFPLWWFGMPAIMKGWFDRVWARGLAYGYKNAGNAHRYGEGGFAGKRALLAVSVGGPAQDYSPPQDQRAAGTTAVSHHSWQPVFSRHAGLADLRCIWNGPP